MHGEMRNKYMEGRDHWKDKGIDGKTKDLKDTGWKVVDWMHLAQYMDQ
jgi:hypothetical protein